MPRTIKTIKTYSDDPDQEFLSGNSAKPSDALPPPLPFGPPGFADFKSRFLNQKKSNARVYIKTSEGREYCFMDTLDKIQSEETFRQYHERSKRAHEPGQYWVAVEYDGQVFEDYGPILIAPQKPEPVAGMQGAYMGGGVADYIHQRITALEQNQQQRQSPNDLLTLVDAIGRLDQMRGAHQPPPQERLSADETLKWIEVGKTLSSAGTEVNGWSILRDAVSAIAGAVAPVIVPHAMAWWQQRNADPAASHNPNHPNPPQRPDSPPVVQPVQPALPMPEPKPIPPPEVPVAAMETMEAIPRLDLAHADEATLKLLRQGVDFLKGEAKKGVHPGQYIDYVLQNDWQPTNDKLISSIAWNQFPAFAQYVDKEIESEQYRQWFRYFYDGLRSAVTGTDPVAVDTGGQAGNGGHP